MDRIADLVASVRANPGICQEIRDEWGETVFFVVEPAVYNRHVKPHIRQQSKPQKPRKPRPAGKQSYRQRHARRAA